MLRYRAGRQLPRMFLDRHCRHVFFGFDGGNSYGRLDIRVVSGDIHDIIQTRNISFKKYQESICLVQIIVSRWYPPYSFSVGYPPEHASGNHLR